MIFIGLGANLGPREKNICRAIKYLTAHPEIELEAWSSFYETEPVGKTDQPDFINAVVAIKTTLSAKELLTECQAVEDKLGRIRLERWGPRVIDVDLLSFSKLVVNQPGELELPHPRMAERCFVLLPLQEIAPEFSLSGTTIGELIKSCPDNSKVKVFADRSCVGSWLKEFE